MGGTKLIALIGAAWAHLGLQRREPGTVAPPVLGSRFLYAWNVEMRDNQPTAEPRVDRSDTNGGSL